MPCPRIPAFREALDSDDEGNQTHVTDSSDDSDDSQPSDVEKAERILQVPAYNADVPQLRKALREAQLAYTDTRSELRRVKKELVIISALLPVRQCNAIGKKGAVNAEIDKQIVQEAKKFAIFYQFFLVDNLFPAAPCPEIDPRDLSHWTSAKSKHDGTLAELYAMMPQSLHKEMKRYPRFGQLFRNTHRQERSNILKSIKEVAGILFTQFKLDPTLVSSQVASKGTDPTLLSLLKHNGTGDYIRLAPILFEHPETMNPDGFLKNPILIKIVHVIIYGKSSLSQTKRGRPKARGERLGTRSVTEGLIAAATIMAHFLLTPDPELTDTGSVTNIPYAADSDFYLERLFKRSRWANNVMDLFNHEIFGQASGSAMDGPTSAQDIPGQSRSWKDELLDQMDSENHIQITVASASLSVTAPTISVHSESVVPNAASSELRAIAAAAPSITAHVHAPTLNPALTFVSDPAAPIIVSGSSTTVNPPIVPPSKSASAAAVPVNSPPEIRSSSHSTLSFNDNHTSYAALPMTSQLQVDLGQMSIDSAGPRNASAGSILSARRVSTRNVTPVNPMPAFVADMNKELTTLDEPLIEPQLPVGRATRARTLKTKKVTKA